MGGTKCLRLGTCELEDMGGVLQRNSSITIIRPSKGVWPNEDIHGLGVARVVVSVDYG